jgi:hypothetical protein
MHHVPLTDSCLVNRRVHAAAMAVADLQLQLDSYGVLLPVPRAKCFLDWLAKYGHHVISLRISSWGLVLQQLRCPNLQALSLEHCSVQLGPIVEQPGILVDCTKLTRLELGCTIMDTPARVICVLDSVWCLTGPSVRCLAVRCAAPTAITFNFCARCALGTAQPFTSRSSGTVLHSTCDRLPAIACCSWQT